jgi:Fur family transcriptional regulator, ferric uptake regulator
MRLDPSTGSVAALPLRVLGRTAPHYVAPNANQSQLDRNRIIRGGSILYLMSKSLGPQNLGEVDFSSVENVLAFVRAQGGRATSSRRILLEVLFDADGHLSAEELTEAVQLRAPDVHLSTIYRNVEELQRLGVIAHSHLGHGPATYQLASLAHAHFICEECGATIEAPDELFLGLARTAKAKVGFTINPHHFAILGRCQNCA